MHQLPYPHILQEKKKQQCFGALCGKAEKAGYATTPWGKSWEREAAGFFFLALFFFFFCATFLCITQSGVQQAATAKKWKHQESKQRPEVFSGIFGPLWDHRLCELWKIWNVVWQHHPSTWVEHTGLQTGRLDWMLNWWFGIGWQTSVVLVQEREKKADRRAEPSLPAQNLGM